MRLDQITGNVASFAYDRFLARLIWRGAVAIALGIFVIVAIYHFSVSGTLALETHYDALNAQVIMGIIYVLAAVVAAVILWATRNRPANGKALSTSREMQLIMLVEAVMLGYSLARKREPLR